MADDPFAAAAVDWLNSYSYPDHLNESMVRLLAAALRSEYKRGQREERERMARIYAEHPEQLAGVLRVVHEQASARECGIRHSFNSGSVNALDGHHDRIDRCRLPKGHTGDHGRLRARSEQEVDSAAD